MRESAALIDREFERAVQVDIDRAFRRALFEHDSDREVGAAVYTVCDFVALSFGD